MMVCKTYLCIAAGEERADCYLGDGERGRETESGERGERDTAEVEQSTCCDKAVALRSMQLLTAHHRTVLDTWLRFSPKRRFVYLPRCQLFCMLAHLSPRYTHWPSYSREAYKTRWYETHFHTHWICRWRCNDWQGFSPPGAHRWLWHINWIHLKISLLLVDMQKKDWPKVYFTQSQRNFFLAGNAVSIPVVKKTLHRGPLGVRSSEV